MSDAFEDKDLPLAGFPRQDQTAQQLKQGVRGCGPCAVLMSPSEFVWAFCERGARMENLF
jgi:hypothetical protein